MHRNIRTCEKTFLCHENILGSQAVAVGVAISVAVSAGRGRGAAACYGQKIMRLNKPVNGLPPASVAIAHQPQSWTDGAQPALGFSLGARKIFRVLIR